ncbi:hypothetical protein ABC383_25935 [Noviherbaspirillum sp. 1P10PC]|uniref:hypothetical protein n=1 Tax=Noviherbaspirillum sp. 1P10PC TaxID=3132292 RepID=UPI0039A0F388
MMNPAAVFQLTANAVRARTSWDFDRRTMLPDTVSFPWQDAAALKVMSTRSGIAIFKTGALKMQRLSDMLSSQSSSCLIS